MRIWRNPLGAADEGPLSAAVEVRDFGPIQEADLPLRPLTVLIGPNNSGKSYAAMLLRAVFRAPSVPFSPFLPIGGYAPFGRSLPPELIAYLQERWGTLGTGERLAIEPGLIRRLEKDLTQAVCVSGLADELRRLFASPLGDLARLGASRFGLGLGSGECRTELRSSRDRLTVSKYPSGALELLVHSYDDDPRPVTLNRDGQRIDVGIRSGRLANAPALFDVGGFLFSTLFRELFGHIARTCHYLPAARSGILQGHKALAASIVERSSLAGLETWEIPRLSGTVSDFIADIITLPHEKGPFHRLVQEAENDIIRGTVVLSESDDNRYPEILYRFHDAQIPLNRASSTVSELAPLFLYLMHKVQPGHVLIIEEPEAHLHPENQRHLAKLIVRLIRSKLNVIFTTHSEYLLEQLSLYLRLGKLTASRRCGIGYTKSDFLRTEEVSVCLFSRGAQEAAHVARPVRINAEDGIPQDEFLRVHEVMYEESIRLSSQMERTRG